MSTYLPTEALESRRGGAFRRRALQRAAAGAAVAAVMAGGFSFFVPAEPANAAVGTAVAGVGVGQKDFPGTGNGWLGSTFVPGIGLMYCVQPGLEWGQSGDPQTVSDWSETYTADSGGGEGGIYTSHINPDIAFRINVAMDQFGQLNANPNSGAYSYDQALWSAATEMYVWQQVQPSFNGVGVWDWFGPRLNADEQTNVAEKIQIINNTVNAAVAQGPGSSTPAPDVSLEINVPNGDYLHSSLIVHADPSGVTTTGTITLEGAIFDGNGKSVYEGNIRDGMVFPITGIPNIDPSNPKPSYRITANGNGVAQGEENYSQQVILSDGPGQATVTTTPKVGGPVPYQMRAASKDPSLVFEPRVTTQAPKFVEEGESFLDTLHASAPNVGPWIQYADGDFVDIRATGTLYGPFDAPPVESDTVPADAPVAGTAEAILNGPGDYTVQTDEKATDAGYYTWVWEIDKSNQFEENTPEQNNAQVYLPDNYRFVDRFGQTVETTIHESNIGAISNVTLPEVGIGDTISDTLDVSASQGYWLKGADGKEIPVTFTGTAYYTTTEPIYDATGAVPADAQVVGQTSIVANAPGQYTSQELTLPEEMVNGYVTWVWEIREDAQPEELRGMVAPWTDGYGLPNETTKVTPPEVTTEAQPDAPIGNTFHDTAIVTGDIPDFGLDLHFELYRATQDEEGNWVCDAGNLLWTSETQRITEEGSYTSEESPILDEGLYQWVEVTTTPNGTLVSRGLCGDTQEQTMVETPTVTTQAQSYADISKPIHDVAEVKGLVADEGYDLSFEAYYVPMRQEADGTWVEDAPEGTEPGDYSWVEETTEPEFVSSEPIHVDAAGLYNSPEFTPQHAGKYVWVETLTWMGGEIVNRPVEEAPAPTDAPEPTATATPEPTVDPTATPTVDPSATPTEMPEPGTVIHRGKIGIANETTLVSKVTTEAQPRGNAGGTAIDTAIVNGSITPGFTISFEAFKSDDGSKVCSASTLITKTDEQALPEGYAGDLRIDSPAIALPESPTNYKVYWIETVRDQDGNIVSTGECGLPNETTEVEGSGGSLAWTGGDGSLAAGVGFGAGILALLGAAGYALRRRFGGAKDAA